MFRTSRYENYYDTRPDTIRLWMVEVFNDNLKNYHLKVKYQPIENLKDIVLVINTIDQRKTILNYLQQIKTPIKARDKDQWQFLLDYWYYVAYGVPLTQEEYVKQQNYLNLETANYEDFYQFVIHPNFSPTFIDENKLTIKKPAQNWIDGDPNRLLGLYSEFFAKAQTLLNDKSIVEIYHLFQNLLHGYEWYSIENMIFNKCYDLNKRLKVIQSIYFLYEKLFTQNPIEYHCNMLWDGLGYCYTMESIPYRSSEQEYEIIRQSMFDTLVKILQIDNYDCQFAALHGLNHVRHPDTKSVILDFLQRHPELNDEEIDYAKACIKGEVL